MSAKIIRFPIRSENAQISLDTNIQALAPEETGYGLSLSLCRLAWPKLRTWGKRALAFCQVNPRQIWGNTQF